MHRNSLPTIAFNKAVLPISLTLLDTLNNVLNKHTGLADGHHIIYFRNEHYTAEHGGYHPVEIALAKGVYNLYSILCITDFSFNGYPYPTLERDMSSISLMPRSSLDTPV